MATSRRLLATALALTGLTVWTSVWSRETASPSACQAAATKPPIVDARSALDSTPDDLQAHFKLADAWSDAGCFSDAVQVLQTAEGAHPGSKELETRLRVARSLVGEEHFFDNLDRANAEARLKRESFRCTTLHDLDACNDALRLKPDDPGLLVAQGDALVRAKRPADAVNRYRLATVIAPNQQDVAAKIATAEGQIQEQAGDAGAGRDALGESHARPPGAPNSSPSVSAGRAATAPAAPNAATTPLRAANTRVAAVVSRRYSNAAPAAQSH